MLLENAKSEFPHLAREDTFIFHLPWLKLEFSLLIFSQLMKVFLSCSCTLCHINQSTVIQDCQHFMLGVCIIACIIMHHSVLTIITCIIMSWTICTFIIIQQCIGYMEYACKCASSSHIIIIFTLYFISQTSHTWAVCVSLFSTELNTFFRLRVPWPRFWGWGRV